MSIETLPINCVHKRCETQCMTCRGRPVNHEEKDRRICSLMCPTLLVSVCQPRYMHLADLQMTKRLSPSHETPGEVLRSAQAKLRPLGAALVLAGEQLVCQRMTAHSWTSNGHRCTVVPEMKVLCREMVLPATPSPPDPFFLSCLDIFWQDLHYNRRLLFYPHPALSATQNGGDGQHLMQHIKSTLAVCLVHYFPWCGRLAKGANPPHRLFIDCNDAGVEFVEASIDMPLSVLAQDGFQMKTFFDQLCQQPDHKGDCLFSSPLLSIQATLFSDGGLALGVAQSHVVADGQSLWDFMVSWGECSRGVPLGLLPVHDRERLAVPEPSAEKSTWSIDFQLSEEDKAGEDLSKVDDKGGSVEADPSRTSGEESTVASKNRNSNEEAGSLPADTSGGCWNEDSNTGVKSGSENGENRHNDSSLEINSSENGDKTPPKPDSLVQWMFTLSASAIKQLKSEAEGFSSFEVTCAHFWQRTAFARKSPPGELTYVFVPINCRSRIAPPLPGAYFGNVIGISTAISTVGRICREPLGATANRLHKKLVAVREEAMEAFMNWLETHDNRIMNASNNVQRPVMKGLNVASSPHFPAYRVDFGWGKPAAVRTVKVTGDGELVFFGGRPGSKPGDVEICTALPSDVLKHLLQDPEFVAKPPCNCA